MAKRKAAASDAVKGKARERRAKPYRDKSRSLWETNPTWSVRRCAVETILAVGGDWSLSTVVGWIKDLKPKVRRTQ
jgi:hypothetical protein